MCVWEVCAYVCMYICPYACMHGCMYVYVDVDVDVDVDVHVYVWAYRHSYTYASMYICMYACTPRHNNVFDDAPLSSKVGAPMLGDWAQGAACILGVGCVDNGGHINNGSTTSIWRWGRHTRDLRAIRFKRCLHKGVWGLTMSGQGPPSWRRTARKSTSPL